MDHINKASLSSGFGLALINGPGRRPAGMGRIRALFGIFPCRHHGVAVP